MIESSYYSCCCWYYSVNYLTLSHTHHFIITERKILKKHFRTQEFDNILLLVSVKIIYLFANNKCTSFTTQLLQKILTEGVAHLSYYIYFLDQQVESIRSKLERHVVATMQEMEKRLGVSTTASHDHTLGNIHEHNS